MDFYLRVGIEEREGPRPELRIESRAEDAGAHPPKGNMSRDGRSEARLIKVDIVALHAQTSPKVLPNPSLVSGALRLHDDRFQGPEGVRDAEDRL